MKSTLKDMCRLYGTNFKDPIMREEKARAQESWASRMDAFGVSLSKAHVCLRQLKDNGCKAQYRWIYPDDRFKLEGCPGCGVMNYSDHLVMDHQSMWKQGGRCVMVISQPYDFSTEEISQWRKLSDDLAVDFRAIHPQHSFYFPGSTALLVFARKNFLACGILDGLPQILGRDMVPSPEGKWRHGPVILA